MEKIPTLRPTLKTKKRYISYTIHCQRSFSKKEFEQSFLSESRTWFGELGTSDLQLQMIKHQDNKGVFKVQNGFVDQAKATLCLMTNINNIPSTVSSVHASGTLKQLQSKSR